MKECDPYDSQFITFVEDVIKYETVKSDSGNLVVGLDDKMHDSIKNTKSIDVVTGSLCLIPSSLHHCTIPFESEEERIVLAFDVLPN